MVVLHGRVASGIGDFGRWAERYRDVYAEYTGMALYPGSLNVVLTEPWSLPAERIHVAADEVGTGVNLVPCRVFDRPAFLMRTDRNEHGTGDHPRTVLEIVADVRLRDLFGLADGDPVEVTVGA
ncbi:DUF120 domain-containing protein [Actinocatenispora rupis]|uniref:Riboflavin kinase domain-containing protein n=1 Tax=Actinocatenispora rupis TaxID=519421 RepID=A0A8J3J783_9ACTN|nr:DUF120 domain-containing protein [Actinocatenispora rupis]GID11427.1 hypothetical protein Aru02nite_23160 [Actinocatenispora rupis]